MYPPVQKLSGRQRLHPRLLPLPAGPTIHGHGHRRYGRLRFASISSSCLQLAFVVAILLTLLVEIYLSWHHPGLPVMSSSLQKQQRKKFFFNVPHVPGKSSPSSFQNQSTLLLSVREIKNHNQLIWKGKTYKVLPQQEQRQQELEGGGEKSSSLVEELPSSVSLPLPIIVVGLPKAGTSTIYDYFQAGGYTASHWRMNTSLGWNNRDNLIGVCMRQAFWDHQPLLQSCGNFDVWAQMDVVESSADCVFPQISYLERIHSEVPNATLILNHRDLHRWVESVSRWKGGGASITANRTSLLERLISCRPPPWGVGPTSKSDLMDWHLQHVQRIRQFVMDHPSHALVEIDIEDPKTANWMETIFRIPSEFWGHSNQNNDNNNTNDNTTNIITGTTTTSASVAATATTTTALATTTTTTKNPQDNPLTTINKQVIVNGVSYSLPQFVGGVNRRDRQNGAISSMQPSSPLNLVLPLPKPIISVGLPKAGTSTIWKFFEQAGYNTSHWKIDRQQENIPSNLIGICMRDAIVNLSLPPLQHCGHFDVWAQLDVSISPEQCVFPQISYLDEIHREVPNATFILNRRELNDWASSVQRWKPAQWKHQGTYSERLSQCQPTQGVVVGVGPKSPSNSSLIAWHLQHIARIRDFVKDHPSHALVEIDIEDPQTGNYMSYLFQTSPEYWGHANHNNKTQ